MKKMKKVVSECNGKIGVNKIVREKMHDINTCRMRENGIILKKIEQ